ncbi:type I-E CRISPR-associated protein Cas6/Cse3/CasE [Leucobacter weissii]|uniref:Type I-E CRISPR-associated protein Cas6/Cse3/CasE n=1 Tax=Leucobacter weissii TaxID=1983706 RepID=A0A939MIA8_9MICO|nr:type I-E CRISPR-associated protein Cas6/Cse3/CasE [Leucobacter weissii]MBO1900540.1 type I-E CRISPR-associated protein Cas6/Cse3/CasE [Leucobacter weissii]
MTYFSRFEINPQRRDSRRILANPQAMHASVLSLFPPSAAREERVLWRLDSDHPHHTLYVVSPERPDFAHLVESAGWETSPGQSLEYARFLRQVTNGSEWLFRVQANPTKAVREQKKGEGPNARGKVIPLVTEAQQVEWLLARASRSGFEVTAAPGAGADEAEDAPELRLIENREQVFFKGEAEREQRRRVTLRKSVFEGKLRVTDEDALRATLVTGLGRARSYGYGLITLRK